MLAAALLPALAQDRTLTADAPVRSVFFLPDGKQITAGWDKRMRTWDIGSGKAISDRTLEPGVMLADPNFLIETKDKGFQIWDLRFQILDLKLEISNYLPVLPGFNFNCTSA